VHEEKEAAASGFAAGAAAALAVSLQQQLWLLCDAGLGSSGIILC
jgi:hypothetical protein